MSQASQLTTTNASYFARHWRGDLSLPKSYWINGVVIGVVCRIVFTALLTALVIGASSMPWLALVFVLVVLANVAVVVWQMVGIWRSAGNYTGPKVWAILARIAVVVAALYLVFVEIQNFGVLSETMSGG
jgi:uncharacterized membrane protein YhhN